MTQVVNQFELGKEKGQLDLKFGTNIIQARAAGELAIGQAVKLNDSSSKLPEVSAAADTDAVFGYVAYAIKDGGYVANDICEIALVNTIMFMEASEAISPMQEIMYVLASGKVAVAVGATKSISGWALDTAATDGDLIRVYITSPSFEAPDAFSYKELVTTAGGAAAEVIVVTGATVGDIVTATINAVGATPRIIVSAIVSDADEVTVTFAADPSTDHVINLIVEAA